MLTALLVGGMVVPGYALDLDLSDARIDADDRGLLVEKNGGPDHFIMQEGLSPGATITKSYLIQNTCDFGYDLWLHAENPADTSLNRDLVDKILLTLYLGDAKIYDGTLAGALDDAGASMENDIYFGTIDCSSSKKLTAVFHVSKDLGNEYQDTKAVVEWVFTASRSNDPQPPPVDPTTPHPTPGSPSVPAPGFPLPQTGDVIQLGILAVFVVALIVLLHAEKRREEAVWDE